MGSTVNPETVEAEREGVASSSASRVWQVVGDGEAWWAELSLIPNVHPMRSRKFEDWKVVETLCDELNRRERLADSASFLLAALRRVRDECVLDVGSDDRDPQFCEPGSALMAAVYSAIYEAERD